MECVIDMNPQPPSPSRRRRRGRGCLCIVTLLGLSLLAFSAAMLALWPSHPIVTLSDATIKDFQVSQHQQLSAEFYLAFSVRNPNHNVNIDLNSAHAAVKYLSGPPLDEVSLPSFHLPGNSTAELQAKLATRAALVDPTVSPRWIKYDVEGSGTTTFDVELSARISYKPWRSLWGLVGTTHILCKDVTVWLPFPDETRNAGSITRAQRNCKVTRSWW